VPDADDFSNEFRNGGALMTDKEQLGSEDKTQGIVAPYKQVHIIINPAAGKDEPILNVLNRVFHEYDFDWQINITRQAGDGTRFAKEAVEHGADLVVGYGGDGTQMEVANGLIGTGVPMAIFPGGTGNSMAHALNVPGNLQGAAELICQSSNQRAVDLAQIGEQHFMLRANTGTEEHDKASRESKDRFGNIAYLMEGMRIISNIQNVRFQLVIDGEEIEAEGVSCLVFNAGTMGQHAKLSSQIQVDDGLLDVLLLSAKLESALALGSYALELDNRWSGLYHRQVSEISIVADPPQPLWLDGEYYGQTPVTIQVVPGAIQVVVP
jgi:YegS/Rv2252/BmrU family lipid kinase